MKTSNLCADIGYLSLNHAGEQLCGDHVEILEDPDGHSTVIVLADGLGSGVKANILSILTSKIISTMVANGLKLEDAVATIAQTLPVCSVRGVAYSTFTILHISDAGRVSIIQYDNPGVILLRDGKSVEFPADVRTIGGKSIRCSEVDLRQDDIFLLFSDGVEHAGVGGIYNFGWKREDIASFMTGYCNVEFTAKTLASILLDETNRLYDGQPGDDATVCAVRIRERTSVNLLIGPPYNRDDCHRMMSLFFSKEGKHIVCGGTTSSIAADYLHKPLKTSIQYLDPEIPPTAEIEGVDLVTEGVITVNRVLEYAKNYLEDNSSYQKWSFKQDGASKIARMLFEDATDINFFVGRAVNPAHQNPNLPINFNIKMKLVEELTECLKKMGKKIKVNYF
jgi:hypothetical protein